MNVCIVASGDFFSDYGGGQVYVKNLVDELICQKDNLALELSVVSFSASFSKIPLCKDYNGIPLFELNQEGDITTLLTKIHPDIVHAHGEKLKVAIVCKTLGIPCIVTAHHGGLVCPAGALLNTNDKICTIPAEYKYCLKCYLRNTPTGLFWHPIIKHLSSKHYCRIGHCLNKLPFIPFLSPIGETGMIVNQKLKDWQELKENATHFIAPSNAIAEALERNGCHHEKISVIPHGIPKLNNNYQFSIFNYQFIKFYYVGRISYIKGIHVLLKSFSSIKNDEIELHIIGGAVTNSEKRYQKNLQRHYKSDSRIVWHGKMPLEQVMQVVSDFHCLVHPAICLEIFGLDIAEALSQHKYIIATRCGGPEMQIHNESEGLLVAPNDANALRDAMLHFINKPLQSNATVESIEDHIKKLIQVYQSVCVKSSNTNCSLIHDN